MKNQQVEHKPLKETLAYFLDAVERFVLRPGYDSSELRSASEIVVALPVISASRMNVADGYASLTLYGDIDPTMFAPELEAACRKDKWTRFVLGVQRATHTNTPIRYEVKLAVQPTYPSLPNLGQVRVSSTGLWKSSMACLSERAKELVKHRYSASIDVRIAETFVKVKTPAGLRDQMCVDWAIIWPAHYWCTDQDIDDSVRSLAEACWRTADSRQMDMFDKYVDALEEQAIKEYCWRVWPTKQFIPERFKRMSACHPELIKTDMCKKMVALCVKQEMEAN